MLGRLPLLAIREPGLSDHLAHGDFSGLPAFPPPAVQRVPVGVAQLGYRVGVAVAELDAGLDCQLALLCAVHAVLRAAFSRSRITTAVPGGDYRPALTGRSEYTSLLGEQAVISASISSSRYPTIGGARIVPFVCPLVAQLTLSVGHVPTDGYHLSGCTWGNGPAGPRKVARRTRNSKHDRRGERQMPDPGRQHRGREAFRPQPNNLRS